MLCYRDYSKTEYNLIIQNSEFEVQVGRESTPDFPYFAPL